MIHVTPGVGVLPQASSQLAVGHHRVVHVVQCCNCVISPVFEPSDVRIEPLLDVASSDIEVVQLPRDIRKAAAMMAGV